MTGSPEREPLVSVVDDDHAVRESLVMLFEAAGLRAAAFASAEAFLDGFDPRAPGCLVLDLNMPGVDGLELQQLLGERGRCPPIIFLTGYGSVPAAVKALKEGAVDFIQKPVSDDRVLLDLVAKAIRRDEEGLSRAGKRSAARDRLQRLTPREQEVMRLVCAGKANKVIAADLDISERTVELHRSRVMRKLRVRSVIDLMRLREEAGLPAGGDRQTAGSGQAGG